MRLPDKFIENMRDMLGSEADYFFAALDLPYAAALRINPRRTVSTIKAQQPISGNAEWLKFVSSRVPWAENGYYIANGARPGASLEHFCGLFYVQEASAMFPASVLGVKRGERVLDLCAAPGGKCTQLADALGGTGVLVANEPDLTRAKMLVSNLERMGVTNAIVVSEPPERLVAKWAGYFDAVLTDAPCSGEGMFRRDSGAIGEWSENSARGCAERQRGILNSASRLVKSGGRLVYSTCTYNKTENEGVVEGFLTENKDFAALDFELDVLGASKGGCLRVFPHIVNGDGQFACLMRKCSQNASLEFSESKRGKAQDIAAIIEKFDFGSVPEGDIRLLGDTVYVVPLGAPDTGGLRVVLPGLPLCRVKGARIEPMHYYAMTGLAKNSVELDADTAIKYVLGEELAGDALGWAVARYKGMPLGWLKGSSGAMKNHLPKGLRRKIVI